MSSARETLTPQMADYDAMPRLLAPHLMYFHPPRYRTPYFETDARGFRPTVDAAGRRYADFDAGGRPTALLVGGSTVFGVGATADAYTLPSRLTRESGPVWLNFGGRAFSSTQEWLLFMAHVHRVPRPQRIVIVSGVNNLILFCLSDTWSDDYGSVFGASRMFGGPQQARGLARWLRRSSDTPRPSTASTPIANHDAEMARVLAIYTRDLRAWRLLADGLGCELRFALQPVATWLDRRLAPEEERLFAELDALQGEKWADVLSLQFTAQRHRWLARHLADACVALDIPFLDLNTRLSDDALDGQWLFVDRVHLTDLGHDVVARHLEAWLA